MNQPPNRAGTTRGVPPNPYVLVLAAAVLTVGLLVPGVYLLMLQSTGVRTQATVSDCETTGSGRYQTTNCTGSWVLGGELLEGGHLVLGTIQGADESNVGKKVDVTIHGDEAYLRDLRLPLLLVGLGIVPSLLMIPAFRKLRRMQREREGPYAGLPSS